HNEPATALRQKLAVERDLLFVAVSDGAVIGTVMGGYDGHRGWVYSVAVRPAQRRKGVGTALLRRLEEAFAARGGREVNLQGRASSRSTSASATPSRSGSAWASGSTDPKAERSRRAWSPLASGTAPHSARLDSPESDQVRAGMRIVEQKVSAEDRPIFDLDEFL